MKLKNFLIESAYFPGMLIATWLTVSSCAAHAQANPGYYLRGVLRTAIKADSLWTADTTIQSDSTLDALNPINGLHVGESAKSWQWDAAKWEWENSIFGWVTDSIKWVSTDTTFGCDCKCEHEWVYSESYSITVRSVDLLYLKSNLVLVCVDGHHPRNSLNYLILKYDSHEPREHCPYEVNEREKICRKCLRSVIEREKWFQRYVAPPKSEFERLKEKQMDKR